MILESKFADELDPQEVETLGFVAEMLKKKRKRELEGAHTPDPKKSTNHHPPKTRANRKL